MMMMCGKLKKKTIKFYSVQCYISSYQKAYNQEKSSSIKADYLRKKHELLNFPFQLLSENELMRVLYYMCILVASYVYYYMYM